VSIVQLINRANAWEGGARDYEFSQRTMRVHWQAGEAAVAQAVGRSGLMAEDILNGRTSVFDLSKP